MAERGDDFHDVVDETRAQKAFDELKRIRDRTFPDIGDATWRQAVQWFAEEEGLRVENPADESFDDEKDIENDTGDGGEDAGC